MQANTALMNNVVTPFVTRYGSNPSIQGFQLYNELNGFSNPCKPLSDRYSLSRSD